MNDEAFIYTPIVVGFCLLVILIIKLKMDKNGND